MKILKTVGLVILGVSFFLFSIGLGAIGSNP